MLTTHAPVRHLLAAASALALALATLVAIASTPASAANIFSEEDFRDAIDEVNGGPIDYVEIYLEDDITWEGAFAEVTGNPISLIIYGQGHTITFEEGAEGFLHIDKWNVTSVFVYDLTVTGPAQEQAFDLSAYEVGFDNVTVQEVHSEGTPVEIYASSNVWVLNSTFRYNSSATGDAGALNAYSDNSEVEIYNTVFRGNERHYDEWDPEMTAAGAVRAAGWGLDGVVLEHVVFDGNTSSTDGGALWVSEGDLHVERSLFVDNYASLRGGAILVEDGTTYIESSSFEDNEAGTDGGALWVSDDTEIYGSLFARNISRGDGGAVYSAFGTYLDVWNSTFHANTADFYGGAIIAVEADVFLNHVTMTENTAPGVGQHALVFDGLIATYASVFADTEDIIGCSAGYGVISNGYNFDDEGSCTSDWDADGDAGESEAHLLGELADNGGPSYTRMPAGDSPLVNAIPTEVCSDELEFDHYLRQTDQRGLNRIVALYETDEGCDIGAVERIGTITFTVEGLDGTVYFTVEGALFYEESCKAADAIEGFDNVPEGVEFPHGVLTWCAVTGVAGSTITVHAEFPSEINEAWKVTGEQWDQWIEIPDAEFDGNTVTFQITDQGELDAAEDEGWIIDPLAVGISLDDEECEVGDEECENPEEEECEVGDEECENAEEEDPSPVTFSLNGLQGPVHFSVTGATAHLGECDLATAVGDAPGTAPAGYAFTHGVLSFCVSVPEAGDTVTVTATFPTPVTSAWKIVGSTWTAIPGVTVAGNTVTYQITDGGALDNDGQANGVIEDPLAAGITAAFTG